MTDDSADADDATGIRQGMAVYDADGDRLGVIDSFTDTGFQVSIHDDVGGGDEEPGADIDQGGAEAADTESAGAAEGEAEGGATDQHEPGQEFGEGYLMWRCDECGEMGEIEDGLPEECPNCGAEKEAIMYWTED